MPLSVVLLILVAWLTVALPVALLVGRAVRLRDRGAPEQREDRWAA